MLVFSTIAAESRRLINETYSSFIQGFMPTTARPDVDRLENLTPAILVDQERLGANVRSTLGTASDVNGLLRILFSRLSTPQIGPSQAFAFNVPSVTGGGALKTVKNGRTVTQRKQYTVQGGICPRCEGTGNVTDIDLTELYDEDLSLATVLSRSPATPPTAGWYALSRSRVSSPATSPSAPSLPPSSTTSSTASRARSRSTPTR